MWKNHRFSRIFFVSLQCYIEDIHTFRTPTFCRLLFLSTFNIGKFKPKKGYMLANCKLFVPTYLLFNICDATLCYVARNNN